MRRFAETAAQNERAIALRPNYPEAYINLGNAWKTLGRANNAQVAYERAIALAPQTPEAHFNLANVLVDIGQLDEAIASYGRALAAREVYPEALHNLGSALLLRGRCKEASERFRQALLSWPTFADAMIGQALAFMIEDRSVEALGLLCRALAIRQSKEAKQLFVAWTQTVNECPNIPGLRGVLGEALSELWSRPAAFSRFVGAVLKSDGPVADLLARYTPAHLEQPGFRLAASDLAALASDSLLRNLLQNAAVVDVPLESLMTAARRGLLAIVANGKEHEGIVPLACAMARQCFLNEYLFDFSESEIALAASERDRLSAACRHGAPVSALRIAAAAAYFPLYGIPDCACLLERPWPETIQALLIQQIREPQAELELRQSIPRVTPISNRISLEVQRQYEENPLPPLDEHGAIRSCPVRRISAGGPSVGAIPVTGQNSRGNPERGVR